MFLFLGACNEDVLVVRPASKIETRVMGEFYFQGSVCVVQGVYSYSKEGGYWNGVTRFIVCDPPIKGMLHVSPNPSGKFPQL